MSTDFFEGYCDEFWFIFNFIRHYFLQSGNAIGLVFYGDKFLSQSKCMYLIIVQVDVVIFNSIVLASQCNADHT